MVNSVKRITALLISIASAAFLMTGCSVKGVAIGISANATKKAYEQSQLTTSTISESAPKLKATGRVGRISTGNLPICIRRRANSSDCSFLKLMDSNFNKTDLNGYQFKSADLSGSTFIGANLQNADLSNANLENCDFRNADLSGASLVGARLRGATMPDGTVHD
jgi:uncharacterized protein YjbI with pentapeptide repeats